MCCVQISLHCHSEQVPPLNWVRKENQSCGRDVAAFSVLFPVLRAAGLPTVLGRLRDDAIRRSPARRAMITTATKTVRPI